MNFEQYIPLALRTEKPLPTVLARLAHSTLGLITEVGEIATEVKRIVIYEKSLDDLTKDGKTTLRQHIAEEIGDVAWYLAIGFHAAGRGTGDTIEGPRGIPDMSLNERLQYATMGIAAGAGTISTEIGMHVIGADSFDKEVVKYELGNIFFGMTVLAQIIEVPMDQILADNIAKLQARFPDAYSNEAAEARADKGGLDARNS